MVRNFRQSHCPQCGRSRWDYGQIQFGCPMTKESFEALRKYATDNGRNWKSKLSLAWTREENLGVELQQARNVVGPSRLHKIKGIRD